jgi:hypothetical protein
VLYSNKHNFTKVKNMSQINTKNKGIARAIIFKSGKQYKAVCLDFDLIEEADTREGVEQLIKESIIGYIKNICLNKLDDKLLNRHADKIYWSLYERHLEQIGKEKKRISNDAKETSMFTMPINLRAFCNA